MNTFRAAPPWCCVHAVVLRVKAFPAALPCCSAAASCSFGPPSGLGLSPSFYLAVSLAELLSGFTPAGLSPCFAGQRHLQGKSYCCERRHGKIQRVCTSRQLPLPTAFNKSLVMSMECDPNPDCGIQGPPHATPESPF